MAQPYSWQQAGWRNFSYEASFFTDAERQFIYQSGISIGIQKSLSVDDREAIKIASLSDEALNTSEIEGEYLDRDSLQSSIQRYFQLKKPHPNSNPRENGIANMMVDMHLTFDEPLTHDKLFAWHAMVMNGRTDVEAVGQYRFHDEPMQIMSARLDEPRVHYEAPPSENIAEEMQAFVEWFNQSKGKLPSLVRAGIAHAYFELIHPFEDGNGRIGRTLIEKVLAQSFGQPTLIAVSQTIQNHKRAYYEALATVNRSTDFTQWLRYFCDMILEAQQYTIASINFLIDRARFFDNYASQLNARQLKMVNRIFAEKLTGFKGGVSVKNYISVTKTSPATANRDLNDLVAKGIMERTGQFKSTRYWFTG